MTQPNDMYIEVLGSDAAKTLNELMSAAWRINETWFEFSDAWFCSDIDVNTMNETSRLFFSNYRNGLLVQLVLDLVNITVEKETVRGAEVVSIGRLISSADCLGEADLSQLSKIRKNMKKLEKLRDKRIAHWNRDVSTGLLRKSRVDFEEIEKAVREITNFLESLHNKLIPNLCSEPIFEAMRRQKRFGFKCIVTTLRSGLETQQQEFSTNSRL